MPVVYIFIDRSGSWGKYENVRVNGRVKRQITKKFILSQTLVNTFMEFQNRGEASVKVHYFGSECASEEEVCDYMGLTPEELNELEGTEMQYGKWDLVGGGTEINPVLDKLRPFENKKFNVVILTDADTEDDAVEQPVHVNGAVWYIFAKAWSKNLQSQITGDFQRRIYYSNLDEIKD